MFVISIWNTLCLCGGNDDDDGDVSVQSTEEYNRFSLFFSFLRRNKRIHREYVFLLCFAQKDNMFSCNMTEFLLEIFLYLRSCFVSILKRFSSGSHIVPQNHLIRDKGVKGFQMR